jgi:3-oxoacyl-[acyl-carrier protein] reductase
MNHIDLKGRVAVITGGAQGIGYATSERMLRSGASVVMWDIDAAKLEEAKASLSKLGKVSGYVVELTSDAAVGATTAQTIKDSGHIDILVNNAGITGGNGTTWDLDPEVWKRVIDVNLMGPYYTCRHVTPHMVSRGWGRIVNIASVAGKEGNPNASHYSVSKAGVIALTKSLAKEVATKGVLVNAVAPAAAKTAMLPPWHKPISTTCSAKSQWGVLLKSMKSPLWSVGYPAKTARLLRVRFLISRAVDPLIDGLKTKP